MSKPSILLIPGSFSLPEFYDTVVDPVAAKGYEIKALHLPSVGSKPGPTEKEPPSMYEDAALIAAEVTKLADLGKDVILIAHSYGGVPATESVKGLGKEERQKEGKKGGIVRLAYLTAIVPPVGSPSADVLSGNSELPNQNPLSVDDKGWLFPGDISIWAVNTFSDLPKEEGEAWIRRFPRHSSVSFATPLTYAGYNDVPVSYLFCEEDVIIPPKNQRDGIDLIERESGNKVDVTSIKTGHVPIVSAPQEVIDWILDIAGK